MPGSMAPLINRTLREEEKIKNNNNFFFNLNADSVNHLISYATSIRFILTYALTLLL